MSSKKRPRPSEIDRPDIQQKRATYRRWRRTVDSGRLIFLDETGANLTTGMECVERTTLIPLRPFLP